MNKILVIGSTFLDIKAYSFGRYIPKGRNAGYIKEAFGGVSHNIAANLGIINESPILLTTLDYSTHSDEILNNLKSLNVETKYIPRTEDGLGTWVATFDETKDVISSISKRPDLTILESVLNKYEEEIFKDLTCVVLEMDIELNVVNYAISLASKYDIPVYGDVSNMTIACENIDNLLKTDCLICNISEAGILFNKDYTNYSYDDLLPVLSKDSFNFGLKSVIITLGEYGSMYISSKEKGLIPSYEANVIDTTGAGDSFVSGVVYGLTNNKSLPCSCKTGAQMAAAVISTTESICPKDFKIS